MQSIAPCTKRHGGAHGTHNTSDCRKYEKDGKIKKSFGKGQNGSTASNKKTASMFTQLLVKIAKLEKANEKLKKSSRSASVIMTVTVMTPTPLEGVGPVAHGGTTVENLN